MSTAYTSVPLPLPLFLPDDVVLPEPFPFPEESEKSTTKTTTSSTAGAGEAENHQAHHGQAHEEQVDEQFADLLALGGALSLDNLQRAYRQGLFPWGLYENHYPLWYCPSSRMVLFPDEFHLSHSLRKRLVRQEFTVRFDGEGDFAQVIAQCANVPRMGQDGTWIAPSFIRAYQALHEAGWAHVVAAYQGEELVGGLYGVAVGRIFCGESMFSRVSDASKVALAGLVDYLRAKNFVLIDCQLYTPHLASLGAREIPRREFLRLLARYGELLAAETWR